MSKKLQNKHQSAGNGFPKGASIGEKNPAMTGIENSHELPQQSLLPISDLVRLPPVQRARHELQVPYPVLESWCLRDTGAM